MVKKVIFYTLSGIILLGIASYWSLTHINLNPALERGLPIDSLDGVYIYYNGGTNQSSGRNIIDDYNVGIRYQCVEFVKRYYYLHYHHRMPDAYGHAKDFFDKKIPSGSLNTARGLFQYKNGEQVKPQRGDLLVFDAVSCYAQEERRKESSWRGMLPSFPRLQITTLRLFSKIQALGERAELI